MAKILNYKGITFDEWVEGEMDGQTTYWTNICPICAEKYQYLLESEIDYASLSDACCGVCGCDYKGYEDKNGGSHYIDFDPEHVKIEGTDEPLEDEDVENLFYDKDGNWDPVEDLYGRTADYPNFGSDNCDDKNENIQNEGVILC